MTDLQIETFTQFWYTQKRLLLSFFPRVCKEATDCQFTVIKVCEIPLNIFLQFIMMVWICFLHEYTRAR